jgi:hypothetical protein
MGREIMIVKKRNKKHSTEYTLIQGDRYFQFEEYFEDYINTFYNKKETKPMFKKGHISFQYLLPKEQWIMASPTWFPVKEQFKKQITNIKEAKTFVKNREYL